MRVLGVRALLDRGLGPPGANVPELVFACVLRLFCESERENYRENYREN